MYVCDLVRFGSMLKNQSKIRSEQFLNIDIQTNYKRYLVVFFFHSFQVIYGFNLNQFARVVLRVL